MCRDIDCQSLAKISKTLADAYILVTFGMADRYNQAGTVREEVCQYMLTGRLQPFTATTRGGDITFREHQQGQRGASYCGL